MINLDESEIHCQDKPGGSTNMSRLQAYEFIYMGVFLHWLYQVYYSSKEFY